MIKGNCRTFTCTSIIDTCVDKLHWKEMPLFSIEIEFKFLWKRYTVGKSLGLFSSENLSVP